MITIISGLPGNGKTLYAVQMLQTRKAEGKAALYKNINGLSPSVAVEWDKDLSEWPSLSAGTLLVVDETQDFAATKGKQGSPEWIMELSKHRHAGVDFVFLTQDPRFLDPWIRRLCNRHIHLERVLGMERAITFEWQRCVDDTTDFHARQRAITGKFKFPRELYPLYKSAEIHTIKRRIPMKVVYFFALIPVCGFLFWYGLHRFFNGDVAKVQSAITADGGLPSDKTGTFSAARVKVLTAPEYIAQFEPVVRAWPWSAPAFQSMKASDYPVPYCMEIDKPEGKDCHCLTQQGTRYNVAKDICIQIATDGVFDPFHSQRRDLQREEKRSERDRWNQDQRLSAQSQTYGGLGLSTRSSLAAGGSSTRPGIEVPGGTGRFEAGPTFNASGPIVWSADQAPAGSRPAGAGGTVRTP